MIPAQNCGHCSAGTESAPPRPALPVRRAVFRGLGHQRDSRPEPAHGIWTASRFPLVAVRPPFNGPLERS